MDGTASDMGVRDSFDPVQNIMGGTKYLRYLLDRFGNDTTTALAAYNAGPGNVEKYGGVPPFNETQNYVKKVLNYLGKYDENLD
jgi:soluble lytic murein transglycosylase-like protein